MTTPDKTLRAIMDPNLRYIDIDTENYIITELVGVGKKWPADFMNMKFSPSESLMNALALMSFASPGSVWGIECIESNVEYEAWVGDKKYAVRAWNPARALFGAVWNKHIMQESENNDGNRNL